jgi:hypothetical protein
MIICINFVTGTSLAVLFVARSMLFNSGQGRTTPPNFVTGNSLAVLFVTRSKLVKDHIKPLAVRSIERNGEVLLTATGS